MQKGHELLIPTAHAHLEFSGINENYFIYKKRQ